jgi:hypothetical protein
MNKNICPQITQIKGFWFCLICVNLCHLWIISAFEGML